MIYRFICWKCL